MQSPEPIDCGAQFRRRSKNLRCRKVIFYQRNAELSGQAKAGARKPVVWGSLEYRVSGAEAHIEKALATLSTQKYRRCKDLSGARAVQYPGSISISGFAPRYAVGAVKFYRRSRATATCKITRSAIAGGSSSRYTIAGYAESRNMQIAKMQTAEYAPRICNHGICRLSICRLAEYTKSPFVRGLLAVSLRAPCGLVKALIHLDTFFTLDILFPDILLKILDILSKIYFQNHTF